MLWIIFAVLVSLTEAGRLNDYTRKELLNHFRRSNLLTPSGEEGEKIRTQKADFYFDKIRGNPDFKPIVDRINAIENFLDTGEMKNYNFDTHDLIDRLEVTHFGYLKNDKDTRVAVHFLSVANGIKIEGHRGLKAFEKLIDHKVPYLATIKSKSCIKVEGQPQLCPVVMAAGIPAEEMSGAFEGSENPEDLDEEDKIANSKILVAYLVKVAKVFAKINSLKFYYGDIHPDLLMWNRVGDDIVPIIGYSNLIVEIIEEPNKVGSLPFMLYRGKYRSKGLKKINAEEAFPSENVLTTEKYTRNADFKEESYAFGHTLSYVIEMNDEYIDQNDDDTDNMRGGIKEMVLEQLGKPSKNEKNPMLSISINEFCKLITGKDLKIIRI